MDGVPTLASAPAIDHNVRMFEMAYAWHGGEKRRKRPDFSPQIHRRGAKAPMFAGF